MDEALTPVEAARILKKSVRWTREHVCQGYDPTGEPYGILVGDEWRITMAALQRFILDLELIGCWESHLFRCFRTRPGKGRRKAAIELAARSIDERNARPFGIIDRSSMAPPPDDVVAVKDLAATAASLLDIQLEQLVNGNQ